MSGSSPARLPAVLALAGGIAALSFSALFVRWAQAPGVVTALYRMAVAAVVLLPAFLARVRKNGLPRAGLLWLPLLGGVFTTLDHATWATAIGMTNVANATLLNNIAPLWVALFAALAWRERLSGRFWLGLALTLSGAALVLGSNWLNRPQFSGGDLLALGSSLFYAGYVLTTQKGRARLDTLTYIWMVDAVAALGLLGLSLGLRLPLSGFPPSTWLAFLGAGVISQIGGYVLIAYALGRLPASLVSPTLVAQPVITALLAIPLAGELLLAGQWAGGAAVLAGILLINWKDASREPETNPAQA